MWKLEGLISKFTLKETGSPMSEKFRAHPILLYLTFVLPILLLALGVLLTANVFLLILTTAWLGVAFVILFLPIASDDGSSS